MPFAPVLIIRVYDTIMLTIIWEKIVRIYKVVRIIDKRNLPKKMTVICEESLSGTIFISLYKRVDVVNRIACV